MPDLAIVRRVTPTRRLLAVLAALALVLLGCSGDDDDDAGGSSTEADETTTTVADATPEQVAEEFTALETASSELPDRIDGWVDGAVAVDDLRRDARRLLVASVDVRELAATLPEGDVKALELAAAELYSSQASTVLEVVNREPSPEREQLTLLALRLGVLGDRVHGWARHVDDPDAADDPEPVPDWSAMDLAPGPPLDEAPVPSDAELTPPLERPTQPEDDWLAAFEAAGAPEMVDEVGNLATQARAFVDAAAALRDEPDPDIDDGHLVAARIRLGWLIRADGIRAAQLGLVTVAGPLNDIALTPQEAEGAEGAEEAPAS